MRARQPDRSGYTTRDGVKIYYEAHGDGATTLLLLPAWSIIHSRMWKAQIPYLARHYRVVVFDGRGNGRSDRPKGAEAYHAREFVADAIAVLNATQTQRAVLVGASLGGHFAAILAARHPERVQSAILISPAAPFGPSVPGRSLENFIELKNTDEGWAKHNQHYWRKDLRGFAEFFFKEAIPEAHSTKQIEDCVNWAMETTPETLIDTTLGRFLPHDMGEALYRTVKCPTLVVHGDDDRVIPHAKGKLVAETLGAPLITLEGSGHIPIAREPVLINRLIRDFVARTATPVDPSPMTRRRGAARRKRALYLSSPIGLGHARRDLAIARALRQHHPDLVIDWLAQHPVTALLERSGEHVHPASRLLANETGHIEDESGEHDLQVFQALRRMDEILVANFMIFQELVEDGDYDLVIADEAWEVDHFWHEHPELKRTALAWLTDFVGYLPMPEGGAAEAALTADYNAEMIGHIARFPRVRDKAIFVGTPEEIVPASFGRDLPDIRTWTEQHFDFCGYITGIDPAEIADRAALRAQFGYQPDEKVCIVTVGGSGVGGALLRRILAAMPTVLRRCPDLRVIVVTGPRIDPASLPNVPGVELRGYIPDLHRHLAACDVALVQGGLTTCMELTAARVPFMYFPLRRHFEQNFHVRHRLQHYGAGHAFDFDAATPEEIADGVVSLLGRPVAYRPVDMTGAARAAGMLAKLI